MAIVEKKIPQELDDNSKYIVRVRSINNFGVQSDWSDSIIVNTESTRSVVGGRLSITDSSIFGYDGNGRLTFGYFGEGITRTNRVKNPSFEVDIDDYLPNAFTQLVRSSDQSIYGEYSMKVTASAAASGIGFFLASADRIVVQPDLDYTLSMFVKNPLNQVPIVMLIGFEFFNSSQLSLGEIWSPQQILIPSDNEWNRISAIGIQAPSTAATASIKLKTITSIPINQFFYIDGLLVEQSNLLKEYFDGSSVGSKAVWSGTAHDSTSVITSNVGDVYIGGTLTIDGLDLDFIPIGGAADDINNNITTISGGKITTGSITTNQIESKTITGDNINSTINLIVGTGSNTITIQGTSSPTTTLMRSGTTAYGTGTGFYMDASGRFSLGTGLTYNGAGALSVVGNIAATSFSVRNVSNQDVVIFGAATATLDPNDAIYDYEIRFRDPVWASSATFTRIAWGGSISGSNDNSMVSLQSRFGQNTTLSNRVAAWTTNGAVGADLRTSDIDGVAPNRTFRNSIVSVSATESLAPSAFISSESRTEGQSINYNNEVRTDSTGVSLYAWPSSRILLSSNIIPRSEYTDVQQDMGIMGGQFLYSNTLPSNFTVTATTSGTAQYPSGLGLTINTPRAGALIVVTVSLDADGITSGWGTLIAHLRVDVGLSVTIRTDELIWAPTDDTERVTLSKTWMFTCPTDTAWLARVGLWKSVAGGSVAVNAAHSTIKAIVFR